MQQNKPEEAKSSGISSVSLLLNEVTMNAMVDKPALLIASNRVTITGNQSPIVAIRK